MLHDSVAGMTGLRIHLHPQTFTLGFDRTQFHLFLASFAALMRENSSIFFKLEKQITLFLERTFSENLASKKVPLGTPLYIINRAVLLVY